MTAKMLELRVPPVALVLSAAAVMWVAARAAPSLAIRLPGRLGVAVIVGLAGVLVCLLGVFSFRRANTTVNPLRPDSTTSLVVGGIYRLTRNPMYLGFLLILLGWAAFLSNGLALVAVVLLALYLDRFQIRPEERALDRLFGSEYADYRRRVRRWI